MATIEDKLRFAAKNELNVMLIGHAGVGKTSIVKGIFEELGLKYLYYSASTMDPWVDFVGVPHEVTGEDGVTYLDLVRPKAFAYDDVEAIFMDEYNRAPGKIQNSVMELVQFKSINGKKFNNLKLVWAAINPSDEDDSGKVYNVETIDPAQMDRFHFQIEMPYTLSKKFFKQKYPEYVDAVLEWWNALPKQQKNLVSPRRVDMALSVLKNGGDLNWVLPNGVNTKELVDVLDNGTFSDRVNTCFIEKNDDKTRSLLSDSDKTLSKYMKCIFSKNEYVQYFMPFVTDEQMMSMITNNNKVVIDYVCSPDIANTRQTLLTSIIKAKSVKKDLLDRFNKIIINLRKQNQTNLAASNIVVPGDCAYIDKNDANNSDILNNKEWTEYSIRLLNDTSNTYDRKKVYSALTSMGSHIYDYEMPQNINLIKNIFECAFIIINSRYNIQYDEECLNNLIKVMNTCILIASTCNIDMLKMINKKKISMFEKSLTSICLNSVCADTLHPKLKEYYANI